MVVEVETLVEIEFHSWINFPRCPTPSDPSTSNRRGHKRLSWRSYILSRLLKQCANLLISLIFSLFLGEKKTKKSNDSFRTLSQKPRKDLLILLRNIFYALAPKQEIIQEPFEI